MNTANYQKPDSALSSIFIHSLHAVFGSGTRHLQRLSRQWETPGSPVYSAPAPRNSLPHKSIIHATTKLARSHATIVLGSLLLNSGMANDQTPAGLYHVDVAWNASPSPEVSYYRIHYGTASETYTGTIEVGNVTQAMIPGLENGVTYFFAVSAVSSTGKESELSNEISYLPGIHETALHTTATGEVVLTVRGLIGQSYGIEATEDLKIWTLISTVTLGESASIQFTDPQAADFPKRFYRTREAL